MSDYEVVERTGDGLGILRKKPLLEQHITVGEYVNSAMIILLLAVAVYSIILTLFGFYKIWVVKDKAVKLKGRKQIKNGIITFIFAFGIWLLLNLINEYFGVNTLCL